ncbi:MAG: hypothetical protein EP340_08990 [Alphaproteobacteria bacterium]|nr:MAG: hypothetical protein EP340_08990 [Alphaproteobacteria bacterium]
MSIFQRDELKAQYEATVHELPVGGEARRPARGNPEEINHDASSGLLDEVFVSDLVDEVWEKIHSDSQLTQEKAYELIRNRADNLRSELVELAYSRKGGLEFSIDESEQRRAENPNLIERGKGSLQNKSKALYNYNSKTAADRVISKNLELSRRFSKFQSIYFGGAIACVMIVVAALFVDFHIIKEFWHSAMVNEYMQLPPELAGSVWFKSFQVLFATIGIHLFLRILPVWGRNLFVGAIFALTVAMMLSLGFLYAHNSLPNDNQATIEGRDTSRSSLGSALESLGLEPENTSVNASRPPVELPQWMEQLAVYDAFGWMLSLSVIFFLVASIGALFLIWAEEGVQKFAVGRDYQNRLVRTERLRRLDSLAFQLR